MSEALSKAVDKMIQEYETEMTVTVRYKYTPGRDSCSRPTTGTPDPTEDDKLEIVEVVDNRGDPLEKSDWVYYTILGYARDVYKDES